MMAFFRKTILATLLLGLSFLAFADPPPESGVVVRYDDIYGDFWFDFDNNWTVYQGLDLFEWCAGSRDFDTISVMEVFMRGDGHRYKTHFSGDLFTSVWPGIVFPLQVCDEILLGNGPIASGIAHLVWNDNDTDPSLNEDRNNINRWGFNTNGTLYDINGERMRFMMYWHAMWDGIDGDSYRDMFKSKLK